MHAFTDLIKKRVSTVLSKITDQDQCNAKAKDQ